MSIAHEKHRNWPGGSSLDLSAAGPTPALPDWLGESSLGLSAAGPIPALPEEVAVTASSPGFLSSFSVMMAATSFRRLLASFFRVLPRLLILPAMPADADENEADAALVLSFTLLMSRALNPLVKPPKKLIDFPAPPSPVVESAPTPLPSCACEWRGTHLVKT